MQKVFLILLLFLSPFAANAQLQDLIEQKDFATIRQLLKSSQSPQKQSQLVQEISQLEEEQLLTFFDSFSTNYHAITAPAILPREKKGAVLQQLKDKHQGLRKLKAKKEAWDDWCVITNIMARNAYFRNDMNDVSLYYQELLKKIEKASNNRIKHMAYSQMGRHYMGVEQNYELAADCFYKTLNIKEDFSPIKKLITFNSLSELYFRKKDYERSLEFAEKVLANSNVPQTIRIELLLKKAEILFLQNKIDEAIESYQATAEQFPPLNDQLIANPMWNRLVGQYKVGLAEAYLQQDPEKHKDFFESLIVERFRFRAAFIQVKFFAIIVQYLTQTNQIETLQKVEYNFSQFPYPITIAAQTYLAFGNSYFEQKEISKALQYYNKLLQALKGEKEDELNTYVLNEPVAFDALTQKLKALQIQKKMKVDIPNLDQKIYQTAQEAVLLLDALRKSQTTKSAKLRMLETTPKIYETALDITTDLYESTKDQKYLQQIYQLIEKSKAMLLADVLAENEAKAFGGIPLDLRKQEKQLQKDIKFYELQLYKATLSKDSLKINTFNDILFEKRTQIEQLKKNLKQSYPKYYQLKFKNKIASIADLQKALAKQEALFLSYFVGQQHLYIFSVDEQSYDLHRVAFPNNIIPNLKQEAIVLRQYLSNFAKIMKAKQADYDNFVAVSHRFYRLLFGEVLANKKHKRLLLSLDGVLHYLPAEVFLTEEVSTTTVDYNNLPYLTQKYVVSYNYTASLWLKSIASQKTTASHNILGMSATYPPAPSNVNSEWGKIRSKLDELEGAQQEINHLKNTFRGNYWMGPSATEKQFKQVAGQHNIIHLALHGIVDNSNPMNSGLVFSDNGDSSSNNILQAYEISALNLQAQLVILSACSTGDGVYRNGEGVMSLGRSFLYAGTPSIITSLWQLNDLSSKQLMELFYQKLQEGLPKDEALQQAKLQYLQIAEGVAAHPAFWSAFVLMGDTSPISLGSSNILYWIIGIGVIIALLFGLRSLRKQT